MFTLSQCWCSHCHIVFSCKEGSRAHADALTDVVGRTDVNVYIVTVLMFTLSHCFQLQRRVAGPRWRTHRRGRANRCRGCCSRGRRPHPRRPPPPRRPLCAPNSSWWTWQAASALVSAAFHSNRIRTAAAVLVNFTALSLTSYFLKRKILSVEVKRIDARARTRTHTRTHARIAAKKGRGPTLTHAGMSGVKGVALREASYINKSLSALADVLGRWPSTGVTCPTATVVWPTSCKTL